MYIKGRNFTRPNCLHAARPAYTKHHQPLPCWATSTADMANVPFIIPELWEVVLDRLFEYRQDNGWSMGWNPHEQSLEGDEAQCFLNCREVCAAFDDYMLRYMAQFKMKPVRYVSTDTIEIEFSQREFLVVVNTKPYRHVIYNEYRIYRPHSLRLCRGLVRREEVHDEHAALHPLSAMVPEWIEQTVSAKSGPIPRHNNPWFLPRHTMKQFALQCVYKTWSASDYAE